MPVQDLDIEDVYDFGFPSIHDSYLQHWISVLLLGATKLTSLSLCIHGPSWTPVLGLLSLRQLELTMHCTQPGLKNIVADVTSCTGLETLKITEERGGCHVSPDLPDLCLHTMANLKSVELLGWCPDDRFTLPPGCVLRLAVDLERRTPWKRIQAKHHTISMLCLRCMAMKAWPVGIQEASGLQYLSLYCKRMKDQDLAALRHIPHVRLVFEKHSTFLLTRGAWRSLEIRGDAGFDISSSNAEEFVRDTERFLFDSTSQEAGNTYARVHEACLWEGVACHEGSYTIGPPGRMKSMSQCSNVDLWSATKNAVACKDNSCIWHHESLIERDAFWPSI